MNFKLAVALIMLWSSVSYSAFAQTAQSREEVKQYFDEQIAPAIIGQQQAYIKSLNPSEVERLTEIKGACNGFTLTQPEAFKQVSEIVKNHPEANKAYQDFIEKQKDKWISEINAIHAKNDVEMYKNKSGQSGPEFWILRLEKPENMLLMDENDPFMRTKSSARKNGMKNKSGVKGQAPGGMRDMSPEMQQEMIANYEQNVLPVLIAQRQLFDSNLDNNEKEVIQLAREKIQVRKAMFKAWHESEDFVPGERRNDPNFDNMRADMQKSMQEVRAIALNHQKQIANALDEVRNTGRDGYTTNDSFQQRNDRKARAKKYRPLKKFQTPVGFLLFDPDKADEENFIEDLKPAFVSVFPNPVISTGTVQINNALGEQVEVVLFDQKGVRQQVLFSGEINDPTFSVPFDASTLTDDYYIIKVNLGNEVISRKVIIKP